ncbi:MAG: substrate-binding domain-containing protein [Verrucomicrobia bacterium]|nr:substrate-binding domain-containing protein [Verrucomicrobiota bacterium]
MKPDAFQLQSVAPAHRQIAGHVRNLIQSGRYPSGVRLPSCHALAARWHSSHNTVHRGLQILLKEGMLRRLPRQGIFVATRSPRLSAIGVCYPAYSLPSSPFQQEILSGLKRLTQVEGVELQLLPDGRSEPREMATPWEPLMTAIESHQIQAVIATTVNLYSLAWLTKLKLPVALFGTAQPNGVKFDCAAWYRMSLRALRRQGCVTVGLISAMDLHRTVFRSERGRQTFHAEGFQEVCGECGLQTRVEWLVAASQAEHENQGGAAAARCRGQRLFRQFWKQAKRPEGLLVDDDNLAEGSLVAMLEMGIRVPDELKLVLHQNAHLAYYCPFPVTHIVTDEHAVARALWQQVQRQFRGEPCELIELQPALTMPRLRKSALRRAQPAGEELCEVK